MKRQTGFTLVELLVVIGIIGILIVALVPLTQGALLKAKETKVKAQAANIEAALASFQASHGGYPGVALDVMAPYGSHGLGDPALYAGAAANAFDATPGWLVNGVLGGYGHYNGVATPWAQQLLDAKNTPLSGNQDYKRYFDALLATDALQEFPPNPFATTATGQDVSMRNVFTFQLNVAAGFNPSASFGAGIIDPNTGLYNCALLVSGGSSSGGAGVTIVPDSLDTTRKFLRHNPLPAGATPASFADACRFGTDEDDYFAPGDFAYIPVLTSSGQQFGDSSATLENEAYKFGTSVSGYLFFAYGAKNHKSREYDDEEADFMRTGLPGYGNPGVDTLYENYALQCFEGAIYFSKKF